MTTADVAVIVVTLALLVGGVVGSVTPLLPGGLLSVAGVALYWWYSGFTDPHALVAVGLIAVGLTAVAVDWLAGVLSAKVSGAKTSTAVVASLVGFALLFVVGPLGLLLGTVGTVFVVEYYRNRDAPGDAKTAVLTAVGILASNAVQAVLTGGVLVAMVGVLLI